MATGGAFSLGRWFSKRRSAVALILGLLLFLLTASWFSATGDDRPPPEYVVDLLDDLPFCRAIIQGDMAVKKDEIARLLGSRKRLSEEYYLNTTKDCNAYIKSRGFVTVPRSAEERDFPIAYSMAIHADVEMFERLLRAVYNPQNVYCVHVDRKSPERFQKAVRAIVSCFSNVFIASKLERVVYRSWSLVQPHLNCMEDLLKSPVQWRYLLTTCGADLPIKTNAQMVRALKLLNGKNNMESEAVPDRKKGRWQYHHIVNGTQLFKTTIRKTRPPIPMFSDSAYIVVTRDFVKHMLENEEIQDFMEWNKDTDCPEEHVWASLNRMSSVPGSLPADRKYDLSDRNAIARLVHWSGHAGDVTRGALYPPCNSTVRRDICVFGTGDLQWVFQHHHLMANKFDPEVDDIAIRCVESILHFNAFNASGPDCMAGNIRKLWEATFWPR